MTEDNKTTVFVIPGGKPERPPEPYVEVRSISGASTRTDFTPKDFTNLSNYPTPPGWKHPLSFDRKPHKISYEKADFSTVEGVPVFYLPDKSFPLVDLTFLFKAGSVDLSDGNIGLTQVFNETLIQGGAGERLSTGTRHDSGRKRDPFVRLRKRGRHGPEAFSDQRGLGQGAGLAPGRSDASEIRGTRRAGVQGATCTALKRQGEDARSVSRREVMTWHFKTHVYGRDPLGGLATIPGITREDLRDFLETYFVPSNMVIAVAGDVEKPLVLGIVSEIFFSLFPKGGAPMRNGESPSDRPGSRSDPQDGPGSIPGQPRPSQCSEDQPGLLENKSAHESLRRRRLLLYTRLREEFGLVYATFFSETAKWKAGTS